MKFTPDLSLILLGYWEGSLLSNHGISFPSSPFLEAN